MIGISNIEAENCLYSVVFTGFMQKRIGKPPIKRGIKEDKNINMLWNLFYNKIKHLKEYHYAPQ